MPYRHLRQESSAQGTWRSNSEPGFLDSLGKPITLVKEHGALQEQLEMGDMRQATLPISLRDVLPIKEKEIPIRLEIHEECTLAFLERDEDFFAEGKTIKEAKENLLRGLQDEFEFLQRHVAELSYELQEKYEFLQDLFS
jgi:bifunctional DNA-binding transcriptional regulator/antitoxin component of YhaV-PrlF toxin-antitoxin module